MENKVIKPIASVEKYTLISKLENEFYLYYEVSDGNSYRQLLKYDEKNDALSVEEPYIFKNDNFEFMNVINTPKINLKVIYVLGCFYVIPDGNNF